MCSIEEYSYELCRILTSQRVKIKTTSNNNIIQHAKLLCPAVWANFADIYYGECVAKVYKAERNFGTSMQFVFALALRENLANQSSGVQIPRDICISFWLFFVLYEVQSDNIENWSNKATMYKMQRG